MDKHYQKRAQRNYLVMAQMTRIIVVARRPNQMMKDQLLVGSNPTALW
jgi:hypothetical protein